MNRLEAIETVISSLRGDELVVHANGAISRESFACADRPGNFYLVGSMGLASAVGLGIALHRPERTVVILDGDGNVLMGLANLALIGAVQPSNLIHVCLDNEVYGTTGDQPTISGRIALSRVAEAAGYRHSCLIGGTADLRGAFCHTLHEAGPSFLQVKVDKEVCEACSRIPYTASEIAARFRSAALV